MRLEDMLKDISGITNQVVKTNCFEGQNTLLESILLIQTKVNEVIQAINDGIIKGDKGDKGDTGETGAKGDKGDTGKSTESIQDGVMSLDTTWSSTKIDSLFKNIVDSQGIEYTAEDNFYSINGSKNGVISNIKLEGKTLVVDSNNNVVIPGTQGATLESVGDGVNEIKLSGTNVNIFDIKTSNFTEKGSVKWVINNNIMSATSSVRYEVDKFIHIKLGKGLNYNISVKNINADIILYDGNVTSHVQNKVITALSNSVKEKTFTSLSDSITIRATNGDRIGSNIIEELQLSAGNSKKTFEEYKVNSKKVLYKDTDGTWKKPTLRQWDSIEKHSDGKYYYHKRSDIYTVNGSSIILDANSGIQVTGYYTVRITIPGMVKTLGINTIISDKFKADIDVQEATEGIYNKNSYNGYNTIGLRLLNSKGSSLQEVKNYITNNPFNVIFKTDIEQVFECTPIDLISYDSQTNYSIECGIVNPKSMLNVKSDYGNVLTNIIGRITQVENSYIEDRKALLSGDFRLLAEKSYPNDFIKKEELSNE